MNTQTKGVSIGYVYIHTCMYVHTIYVHRPSMLREIKHQYGQMQAFEM